MTAIIPQIRLTNRTFDELEIGESASLTRFVSEDDIKLFAATSGDVNPAHLDAAYAATDIFGHVVIHGMWTAALISAVLGTELPGPGAIYLGQSLRFSRPVGVGDTVTATVTVTAKKPEHHIVTLACACINQIGETVISGEAEVKAPTEKVSRARVPVPDSLHGVLVWPSWEAAQGARRTWR